MTNIMQYYDNIMHSNQTITIYRLTIFYIVTQPYRVRKYIRIAAIQYVQCMLVSNQSKVSAQIKCLCVVPCSAFLGVRMFYPHQCIMTHSDTKE